jgi:hypothetical protein
VFEDSILKEVTKLKLGLWGWALIQSYWYPYEKRKFQHWEMLGVCTQEGTCEDTMRRWPSASHVEWPQNETNPVDILILDFQLPQLWENKFLLIKPSSLWCCYDSPSVIRVGAPGPGDTRFLVSSEKESRMDTGDLSRSRLINAKQSESTLLREENGQAQEWVTSPSVPWPPAFLGSCRHGGGHPWETG